MMSSVASSAAKCSPTRSRRGTGLRRASAVQVFDLDTNRTRHGRSTDGVVNDGGHHFPPAAGEDRH
jgi:hypothetical protein